MDSAPDPAKAYLELQAFGSIEYEQHLISRSGYDPEAQDFGKNGDEASRLELMALWNRRQERRADND